MEIHDSVASPGHDGHDAPEIDVSLWTFAALAVRHRRFGAICTALLLLLGSVWIYRSTQEEDRYTTMVSLMSDDAGAGGGGGSASPLALLSGGSGGAPALIVDFVSSRALFTRVAAVPLKVQRDTGVASISLATLAGAAEATAPEQRATALSWISERVRASIRSGSIIEVHVSAPEPQVSVALAERIVEELQRFNAGRRQGRAAAEREFIGRRLEDLQAELAAAEGQVVRFLHSNRRFEESPELRVEFERLRRNADLKQQLVVTLAQSYERARMEEARDTPTISMLDQPELPLRPDARSSVMKQAVALLIVSLGAGVAAAVILGLMSRTRASAQYEEFRRDVAKIFASR